MSQYGEPWRAGESYQAIVTDRWDAALHCCPRKEYDDADCHRAYGGWLIGESVTETARERIILCVNALAGVSNETLKAHIARGGYYPDPIVRALNP